MAGVNGEFDPFRWEGLAVDTDSFEATSEGLVTGCAGGRAAHGNRSRRFDPRGLGSPSLQLAAVRSSVDATERRKPGLQVDTSRNLEDQKSATPLLVSKRGGVRGLDVGATAKVILEQGLAAKRHERPRRESRPKEAYRGEIKGGTLRLPTEIVPELRVDRVLFRYQDGQVFYRMRRSRAWRKRANPRKRRMGHEIPPIFTRGRRNRHRCEDLLSADWSKRLTGDVSSDFTMSNKQEDFP